jgi:hypothetical protein
MYTTKTFIVPHLRLIIAGTGVQGFLGRWFVRINDGFIVRGIDNLNYHAPRNLPSIWEGLKKELSIQDGTMTTVYHFGFSEETGLIHSYAYRSTSNFQSEAIPYGIGVKPECTVPSDCRLPDDLRKMMDQQREIQASSPQGEKKIYIGGEIQVHHLSQEGFCAYTLGRFDDYRENEKSIYQRINQSKGPI